MGFITCADADTGCVGRWTVSVAARAAILTACLVPYVYFGVRDVLHHKQHRPVSMTERILHLTLGVTLSIVIPHAFLGHWAIVLVGIVLFILARLIDEFVFHRRLAGAESDLHAKTHLGFLIFVVGLMSVNWLEAQQ